MRPYYDEDGIAVYAGDVLDVLPALPAESAQTCVTSPPYWGLRDYGKDGQLGLEPTPEEYVANMVAVFREVRRVLRDDGTLWLNLGDSYYAAGWECRRRSEVGSGSMDPAERKSGKHAPGLKVKDLVGIPWRVAFALQEDGWYLRSDIIWSKPNPMPESVTDRPTKSHEYLFLLSKSAQYRYDHEAIREEAIHAGRVVKASDPETAKNAQKGKYGATAAGFTQHDTVVGDGRNRRSVWTVATQPFPGAHFATFPPNLIEPCIKAGARPGDTVLDPFAGALTTAVVAKNLGCAFVGSELNAGYIDIGAKRLAQRVLPFGASE